MTRHAEQADLVVIGAGIAGVACAELIARTSAAQRRRAKIIVLDSAPSVGCGASGSLQGWFHTGALYSTLQAETSTNACARSLDLLWAQYGATSDFKGKQHVRDWFHAPVRYDIEHGVSEAQRQRARTIVDRIRACSSPDPTDAPRHDRSTRVITSDRGLDTSRILSDLAGSASHLGVEFRMAHAASSASKDGHVSGIGPSETPFLIEASRVILANGRFIPTVANDMVSEFTLRIGIILAATPALCDVNTVRVAATNDRDLSHIVHGHADQTWSAMGDSTSLPSNPDKSCVRDAIEHTVRKVIDMFGTQAVASRRVSWHLCTKVERRTSGTDPTLCPFVSQPRPHDRRIAMIPGKFSLFPLASHSVLQTLGDAFFQSLPAGSAEAQTVPAIAPTRAERLLSLSKDASPADMPGGSVVVHPNGEVRIINETEPPRPRQPASPRVISVVSRTNGIDTNRIRSGSVRSTTAASQPSAREG
ncbi:MAG: FAD-dependent oxidoreductase [Planctomycetota bacterium]